MQTREPFKVESYCRNDNEVCGMSEEKVVGRGDKEDR